MTHEQAQRVFAQLRARIAARYPVVQSVRLVIRKRHFLRYPQPRDLAWYEDGVVTLLEAALRGPAGRVGGLLAHELGHAADPVPHAPYAERRADAMAALALGQPILYDHGNVQNLDEGVTPRPAHLPENRPHT